MAPPTSVPPKRLATACEMAGFGFWNSRDGRADRLGRGRHDGRAADHRRVADEPHLHHLAARDLGEQLDVAQDRLRADRLPLRRAAHLEVVGQRVEQAEEVGARRPDVEPPLELAHEGLLARRAQEVGVEVAIAHVLERLEAGELLVAGLEVDRGVVARAAVGVVVAPVDVEIDAAERVHRLAEEVEVDRHVVVDLHAQHLAHGLDRERRTAVGVGLVDLARPDALDRHVEVARQGEQRQHLRLRIDADQHERVRVAARVPRAVALVVAEHERDGRLRRRVDHLLELLVGRLEVRVVRRRDALEAVPDVVRDRAADRDAAHQHDRERPAQDAPERPALVRAPRRVDVDVRRRPEHSASEMRFHTHGHASADRRERVTACVC